MWRGLGRGLGTNAHVTTPGGLGFGRDPLGGVSARALGGPHDMVEPHYFLVLHYLLFLTTLPTKVIRKYKLFIVFILSCRIIKFLTHHDRFSIL
ncbi:hypothetical protein Hanom_Chr03g00233761 [Helianthus anomalus]